MAELKSISLPHGSIPTQMFGNVNLQNAMMYVNENFAAVKEGVNDAISATNTAIAGKSDADHDHNDMYSALEHTHGMSEITGLNAALDEKAALNHEHSQYLSSLPAHYHDMSAVQGLGESLQAKAEKAHSHTIAQVENLSTELGVRASTSYVDQQISSVSSSIKTIADNEIEEYGSSRGGGGGSESQDVPIDTEIAPNNETVEQKNARVGSANRWARADHKHVFSSSIGENPIDDEMYPSDAEYEYPEDFDFTEWEAGNEDRKGVKLSAYVMLSEYDGTRLMMPIVISVTKDGLISSIKKSTGAKCLQVTF